MKRTHVLAAFPVLLLLCLAAAPEAEEASKTPGGPPAWLEEHMQSMARGSGRWETDNAPYRSEKEPSDAYGMEWRWGIGRSSITGRLFGIKEGREIDTFWEYRLFWDPGTKKAMMLQFAAWGAVGMGEVRDAGEGTTEMEQVFHEADGSKWEGRHRSTLAGDEYRTESFSRKDGGWASNRVYVWHRRVMEAAPTAGPRGS